MEVKGLYQYSTSLSVSMRKQCQNFSIYRIEPVEEVISITAISNNAGKCRSSDFVKKNLTCDQAMALVNGLTIESFEK